MILLITIVLVSAALFQQRLNSEIRLARLETSNEVLTQQLLQVQSNLILSTPAPAPTPVTAPVTAPNITVTSDDPAGPVKEEAVQLEQTPPATAPPISRRTGDSWFINLGTFSSHSAAQNFADSLRPTSHSLELTTADISGRRLYRVRLVNLPSEELADNLARDYELSFGGQRLWVGRD